MLEMENIFMKSTRAEYMSVNEKYQAIVRIMVKKKRKMAFFMDNDNL